MISYINAQNISVIRQNKIILDNVSLTIGKRDFITLVGPNGAGKSILLKCLMGFFKPDKGHINRQKGLRIGYVPQRLHPDPSMPLTVKRFIQLGQKYDRPHFETILEETSTKPLLRQALFSLSGGELQRVLLARSLMKKPRLLILDEPAQNLDISGQLAFYKLIERLYEKYKMSILMVSHDLHMVMASTQKVVCLYHHICCSGTPQKVTQDPEFISLFGDDMASMMAVYQHHHHVQGKSINQCDDHDCHSSIKDKR